MKTSLGLIVVVVGVLSGLVPVIAGEPSCWDLHMKGSCLDTAACKARKAAYEQCLAERRGRSDPNLRPGGYSPTSQSPSQKNMNDLQDVRRQLNKQYGTGSSGSGAGK